MNLNLLYFYQKGESSVDKYPQMLKKVVILSIKTLKIPSNILACEANSQRGNLATTIHPLHPYAAGISHLPPYFL